MFLLSEVPLDALSRTKKYRITLHCRDARWDDTVRAATLERCDEEKTVLAGSAEAKSSRTGSLRPDTRMQ